MNFIMMPIPEENFTAVCALLGGASLAPAVKEKAAPVSADEGNVSPTVKQDTAAPSEPSSNGDAPLSDTTSSTATSDASPSDVDDGSPDVDAHGWPWDAEIHASTKGTTKDGLWRMKPGATRPEPKPGFPKPEEVAPAEAETATAEDDEFAAFREAAAKADAEDETAKASVPARKWTDADLGSLCNQAAVKMGDPAPIKAIIAEFVPETETPHSRNIPEDKRAEFAAAIEEKAGIEFAG